MSNIKTVNINSMMKKMITIGVMDARLFCGHCQICHPYCRSVDDGCQLKDVMVDIGYARHARIQQKRSPQMYYINIARSAEREWMVKTMDDLISRHDAIDALWKALYEYEDKTEKQFQESDELDVGDWMQHRIFVQNMSDIDRQTILALPSAERKKGKWIEHEVKRFDGCHTGRFFGECSECGKLTPEWRKITEYHGWNYCPNCGIDMRK